MLEKKTANQSPIVVAVPQSVQRSEPPAAQSTPCFTPMTPSHPVPFFPNLRAPTLSGKKRNHTKKLSHIYKTKKKKKKKIAKMDAIDGMPPRENASFRSL